MHQRKIFFALLVLPAAFCLCSPAPRAGRGSNAAEESVYESLVKNPVLLLTRQIK